MSVYAAMFPYDTMFGQTWWRRLARSEIADGLREAILKTIPGRAGL